MLAGSNGRADVPVVTAGSSGLEIFVLLIDFCGCVGKNLARTGNRVGNRSFLWLCCAGIEQGLVGEERLGLSGRGLARACECKAWGALWLEACGGSSGRPWPGDGSGQAGQAALLRGAGPGCGRLGQGPGRAWLAALELGQRCSIGAKRVVACVAQARENSGGLGGRSARVASEGGPGGVDADAVVRGWRGASGHVDGRASSVVARLMRRCAGARWWCCWRAAQAEAERGGGRGCVASGGVGRRLLLLFDGDAAWARE
jgi:hypothetical protein